MDDALERARAFAEVGGILVHSYKKDSAEIARGCDKFRA